MSNPNYPEGVTERDIDRAFPLTEESDVCDVCFEEGCKTMQIQECDFNDGKLAIAKVEKLSSDLAKAEQLLKEKRRTFYSCLSQEKPVCDCWNCRVDRYFSK